MFLNTIFTRERYILYYHGEIKVAQRTFWGLFFLKWWKEPVYLLLLIQFFLISFSLNFSSGHVRWARSYKTGQKKWKTFYPSGLWICSTIVCRSYHFLSGRWCHIFDTRINSRSNGGSCLSIGRGSINKARKSTLSWKITPNRSFVVHQHGIL